MIPELSLKTKTQGDTLWQNVSENDTWIIIIYHYITELLCMCRQGAPRKRRGPMQGTRGRDRFKSEEAFYTNPAPDCLCQQLTDQPVVQTGAPRRVGARLANQRRF